MIISCIMVIIVIFFFNLTALNEDPQGSKQFLLILELGPSHPYGSLLLHAHCIPINLLPKLNLALLGPNLDSLLKAWSHKFTDLSHFEKCQTFFSLTNPFGSIYRLNTISSCTESAKACGKCPRCRNFWHVLHSLNRAS